MMPTAPATTTTITVVIAAMLKPRMVKSMRSFDFHVIALLKATLLKARPRLAKANLEIVILAGSSLLW